ncbi:MAG: ethanolamine ammonia-lyase subunit EutC [Mycobacterium sp.]|nr:ethanolamine ammonia-lyase subunit EutC [Mycobacterium sp.]
MGPTVVDAWAELHDVTSARIGLARAGASIATAPSLALRLAHARARDAVHNALDVARLAADLGALGREVVQVQSQAADRQTYLMRPDLGRALSPNAAAVLQKHKQGYDVTIVLADGLSARAVQEHAPPVLQHVTTALPRSWRVGPLVIARQGRVAIGDAIAEALQAECVAVLIGERPGLSAPDSMGAYLTYRPHGHTTDADRNCISNIRPDGIGYADAAFKLTRLLLAMRARKISGVALKDERQQFCRGRSTLPSLGTSATG